MMTCLCHWWRFVVVEEFSFRTSVFLTSWICFLYFVATFPPLFLSFSSALHHFSEASILDVSGLSVVRLSVPLSVPRRLQMWSQVIHLEVKGCSHNTFFKPTFWRNIHIWSFSVLMILSVRWSLHLLYRFITVFAPASSSSLLSFSFFPRLLCLFFLALCRPLRESWEPPINQPLRGFLFLERLPPSGREMEMEGCRERGRRGERERDEDKVEVEILINKVQTDCKKQPWGKRDERRRRMEEDWCEDGGMFDGWMKSKKFVKRWHENEL